ncbi:MAG: bifunctional oligoribonuclease/PAP phosphatase NrnA [Spirochaetaceae bacterium]|jgi:phosphoesterase RecJ-like protein|nr:bifunctional oligoribonuclease/PAP phosphatase NrnA [Spirochaetaceae bacterium]
MLRLTDQQVAEFRGFVDSHNSFILGGHREPDGDCLMSCLGMAKILEKLGKPYRLFSAGPFKRSEIKEMESLFPDALPGWSADELKKQALIILDCAEVERLGEVNVDLSGLDVFIIDHHHTSMPAAGDRHHRIIDPGAPATALIVHQLYERIIGVPDEETAGRLFFGLVTDTNFFRFLPSHSGTVFQAAGRLTDAGAVPRTIYDDISAHKPFLTRKLLGLMLDRAEQRFGGQVIHTWETIADTQKFGKEGRDSDALYQLFLSVERVRAVLFVRQEKQFKCTVGMRSKGTLDVGAIAAKFGGGGHTNAAGLTMNDDIKAVRQILLEELERAL